MRNIWPRTDRIYLLTCEMEASFQPVANFYYSFSVLFLFLEQNCQILTVLDIRLYLLPGFVIPLGKTLVAWWDTTNHSIMQRDMKLQQMQISTSSGLLSFSAKSAVPCWPTMHRSQRLVAFILSLINFFRSKTCWRWSKLLLWKRRRLKTRNASCCVSKEGSSLCCSVR